MPKIGRNSLPSNRIDLPRRGGMDMAEEGRSHTLQLSERKQLTMTGVSEVVSFDETVVVLQTSLGTLVVQGEQLQLKNLSQDGGPVWTER